MPTLGKYQLGELIGQGGMGAVYRSFHPHLNRPVAIKVLLNANDPETHQRFMREAQVVAGLSHPNIINIFDIDVADGRPFMAMELIEGGNLARRIANSPLPVAEALALLVPLTDALDYAHRQGLIHRDIKPANVLLRPDSVPILADFGLARPVLPSNVQITATGAVLGTVAYMAPEQFTSGAVDARTDIYALGVMLFEMLTGHLPFEGDSGAILIGHLQQPPPSLRTVDPSLPAELERLIARMLAKDPAARPQNVVEIAADLRAISQAHAATGQTIALRPASTIPVLRPAPAAPARSVPWAPLLALALVLIAALVLIFRPSRQVSVEPITVEPITIVLPTVRPTTAEVDAPTAALSPTPLDLERVSAPLLTDPQPAGPESFTVGGMSYLRKGENIWFYGEVRNDSQENRERIQIRINLLDESGKELATKIGYISLNYLKPGEIAPFLVLFSDGDTPQFASYAVEVRSDVDRFNVKSSFRALSMSEVRLKQDRFGFIHISGRVRNDGDRSAKYVAVHAVFYDVEGKVVGIGTTYAETSSDNALPAGAEARFEMQESLFTGVPTRYRLFAEGLASS